VLRCKESIGVPQRKGGNPIFEGAVVEKVLQRIMS
jgi:hypothetical protein